MIFQLINEDQADWTDGSLIDALENILKAFSERKHIVLASSSFFDKVNMSDAFAPKVKHAASIAKQYRRELQALIKQNYVNSYIRIDLTQNDSFQILEENEQTVFESGFGFFTDSLSTQNTCLIGEDINDAHFYIHIGDFYIRNHSNLSQCALSARPSHGGGNRTANTYHNFLHQKELCCCIVDSDKKHPSSNCPKGDTCKAFVKNANCLPEILFNKIGQVRILDVHEVESLIPINILKKIFERKKQVENQIDTIKTLEILTQKNSDIRKYFDHKNGLTFTKATELDQKYQQLYFTTELKKLFNKNNQCFLHKDEENFTCDDNCLNLKALSGKNIKLLDDSIEILDNISLAKEDIDPIILPYWSLLGKEIFSWCCCFDVSMRAS